MKIRLVHAFLYAILAVEHSDHVVVATAYLALAVIQLLHQEEKDDDDRAE